MRILILGANLAGLLSALQMRRQGHEVNVLVHGPEGAYQTAPPLVLTDPGPWGTPQGALSTLWALLNDRGDLRCGQDGLGQLGWLMRCLGRRSGGGARSQALRAVALARRSQQAFHEMQGSVLHLQEPQPVTMLCVHTSARAARQQQQRGPMWHLGTPPTLARMSTENLGLPQLDATRAQASSALQSEGWMLGDGAAVLADLRHQLVQQGVRFLYDQTIDGVEHTGQHIHAVTLRGTLNLADEVDCDLVVAASYPAAQPLLRAVGLKPDLAPMSRLSLQVTLPEGAATPLYIHDLASGTRLIRQGRTLWAHGPTWLGEPDSPQPQEVGPLSVAVSRYFGQDWAPTNDQPLRQTSWVAPDGLPLVSRTPTRNLLLNLGHHSASAALAFGAAAQLRTLMDTRQSSRPTPAIPTPWSHSASPLATSTQGSRHD
ncbi:FAD-dependent oxidoreductase [Ideonella sp.]|jgi:D-amino-acid dehydrogenase|uniref:FAD-dependent oxidoreductase n=1 Tax=Ideonella sp. TaxID=1929293 RepID=UPI0037C05572